MNQRFKRACGVLLSSAMVLSMCVPTNLNLAVNAYAAEPGGNSEDPKGKGYADVSTFLDKHVILVDREPYNHTDKLNPYESFSVDLDFSLTRAQMRENGLKYYYILPEHISIGDVGSEDSQRTLYNAGGIAIGTYYISKDVIYFSFPGYYDTVSAFFTLKAEWDGVDGKTYAKVSWPDEDETVLFDLCALTIVKDATAVTEDENGVSKTEFTVTIRPMKEDLPINDVIFEDTMSSSTFTFLPESYDTANGKKDICVKAYAGDGSVTMENYYTLDEVGSTGTYSAQMKIEDLDVPKNGCIKVTYFAEVTEKAKMKMDATGSEGSVTNSAKASYILYDDKGNEIDTLSASTKKDVTVSSGNDWMFKDAGECVPPDTEGNVVVPYTVTVNRFRPYSLGGSIVHDEITQYDPAGGVTYLTDSTDYVPNVTVVNSQYPETDNHIEELKWKILSDDLYEKMDNLLYKASANTAMANLLNGTGDYATLRSELCDELGITTLTDTVVSEYIFTADEKDDFIWLMPFDTEPTTYMLRYHTVMPSGCLGNKNSASMWYTEIEGYPKAPGGFQNPYKKVMEIDKENFGVYEDGNGRFLVDWHISLTVPKNSHFDHIMLYDENAYYDEIQEYYDWFPAAEGFSLANWEKMSTGEIAEYEWDYSDRIYDISTKSNDPAIRKVVENMKGVFSDGFIAPYDDRKYALDGDPTATSPNAHWTHNFQYQGRTYIDPIGMTAGSYFQGLYSGQYFPLGQLMGDFFYDGWSYDYYPDHYTWTPVFTSYYIESLPASSEDYTIDINYTTQVNPALVNALPEILEKNGLEYVTLTNTVSAYQGIYDAANKCNKYTADFLIGEAEASYYIGFKDIEPNILKHIKDFDETAQNVTYQIEINPNNTIDPERTEYILKDVLSYATITYQENDLTMTDEDGKVVWSTDTSKSVDSKYQGSDSYVKMTEFTNPSDAESTYSLTLDNSTGFFENEDGSFKHLFLTYDVNLAGWNEEDTVPNAVYLYYLDYTKAGTDEFKNYLGSDDCRFSAAPALAKEIVTEPDEDNSYTASYEVVLDTESVQSKELLGVPAGTKITMMDTYSENLTLNPDSLKLYALDAKTERYTEMPSGSYSFSLDEEERAIYTVFTTQNGVSKYKLAYDMQVNLDKYMQVLRNKVSVLNTSIVPVEYEKKVYTNSYNAGADASTYKVILSKYDSKDPTKKLSAQFELYYLDENLSTWVKLEQSSGEPFTTDPVTGKITITNQLCDAQATPLISDKTWYSLVEVKAPAGYERATEPIYYYVTASGTAPKSVPSGIEKYEVVPVGLETSTKTLYISNHLLDFNLRKCDSADYSVSLTGAEFTLYSDKECKNAVAVSTDNQDGTYTFKDLDTGDGEKDYYLKETKAPKCYNLDTNVYRVSIVDSVAASVSALDKSVDFPYEKTTDAFLFPDKTTMGSLEIDKNVVLRNGINEVPEGLGFLFSARFYDENGKELSDLEVPYVRTNADGTIITGEYCEGDVLTLGHKEKIVFMGLADGIKYEVREVQEDDYSTYITISDAAGTDSRDKTKGALASGTIEAGYKDTVIYENDRNIILTFGKKMDPDYLEVADGFSMKIVLDKKTDIVTATWNEKEQEFTFDYHVDGITCENVEDEVKFVLHGLGPEYEDMKVYIYESGADIPGYSGKPSRFSHGKIAESGFAYSYYALNSYSDPEMILTNRYTASADADIEVHKELQGRDLQTGEFLFTLYDASNDEEIETVTNGAFGIVEFTPLKFTEPTSAKYYIKEKVAAPYTTDAQGRIVKDGVTYDDNVIYVDVEVALNPNGKLVATTTYSSNGQSIDTFVNEYHAEGTLKLDFTKKLQDSQLKGNDFSFTLTDVNTKESKSAKNDATGNASIALSFTEKDIEKEYVYTLKEDIPAKAVKNAAGKYVLNGVEYDSNEYTIHVVINDNKNGTLGYKVTGATLDETTGHYVVNTSNNDGTFVNDYNAKGSITLEGTKQTIGKTQAEKDYTFSVVEMDSDYKNPVKVDGKTVSFTGYNTKSDVPDEETEIVFDTISYTEKDLGTHYYEVTENIPSTGALGGITYDDSVFHVAVNVTDNYDGTLKCTMDKASDEIAFVNKYNATGSVTLSGTKELTGKEIGKGEFEFLITECTNAGRNTTKKKNGTDITYSGTSAAAAMGTDGKATAAIDFKTISYDLSDLGAHYYVVEEIIPEDAVRNKKNGVTYTTKIFYATVNVTDNGDGTLNSEVTYDSGLIKFENKYEATGSVRFEGTKTLKYDDIEKGDYTVTVTEYTDSSMKTVKQDSEKKDIVYTATVPAAKADEAVQVATSKIAYPEITYGIGDCGTHYYKVMETRGSKPGVSYSTNEYQVTVTVADKKNGTLAVTASDNAKNLSFINCYNAKTALTFTATKFLEGRTIEDGQFEFGVYEGDVLVTSGTNDADGKVVFDPIDFYMMSSETSMSNNLGQHDYVIREIIPATQAPGYQYDKTEIEVSVTAADNKDGTIGLTVTNADTSDGLTFAINVIPAGSNANFNNSYYAEGSATFAGEKTLINKSILKDEFTFVIKEYTDDTRTTVLLDNSGNEVKYYASVNAADVPAGDVKAKTAILFPEIRYDNYDLGTHYYTVEEEATGRTEIADDPAVYSFDVLVTDNGDGTLAVTPDTEAFALNFTNVYSAQTALVFEADKVLEGRAIEADQFSFEILEGANVVATGKNDADGKIVFTGIDFTIGGSNGEITNIGKNEYVVRECIPTEKAPGYTYDETEYPVSVESFDNGDGTIGFTVTGATADNGVFHIDAKDGKAADFVNSYHAEGSTTFAGTKTAAWHPIGKGDFNFTVTEYSDAERTKIKTDAAGEKIIFTAEVEDAKMDDATKLSVSNILFPEISYNSENDLGEHYYVINENVPEDAVNNVYKGTTYSKVSYDVTVTVTDNGDGTLKAENTENAAKLNFTNYYNASGSIRLSATKALEGRKLEDGQFSFELLENGKVLSSTTNDVLGNVVFDELNYAVTSNAEGMSSNLGEHEYVVREVIPEGGRAGYTFDKKEYRITVDVIDREDGTLLILVSGATPENGCYEIDPKDDDKTNFINIYEATDSSSVGGIKGIEHLKDLVSKYQMADGDFAFAMYDITGLDKYDVSSMTPVASGKSMKDGRIVFDNIEYEVKDIGIHNYIIVEKADKSVAGVINNAKPVFATSTVTDNGDGTLTTEWKYKDSEGGVIAEAVFVNGCTKVSIAKTDESGKPVSGAKLQILDSKGNVITEFTSDSAAHMIYGLEAGKTYTLREISAPEGYEKADDVRFTVASDDSVLPVKMVDRKEHKGSGTNGQGAGAGSANIPGSPLGGGTNGSTDGGRRPSPENPILGVESHSRMLGAMMMAVATITLSVLAALKIRGKKKEEEN